MLNTLWQLLKRILGMDVAWEMMTLSRVAIDPVSARSLTRVLQPVHTIRLRPEPEASSSETLLSEPLALSWHGITDTGLVRDHNEDAFATLDLGTGTLLAVADGMGGHDAGEVASAVAVNAACSGLREGYRANTDLLLLVERAVQRANGEVKREASRRGSNMGTTLSIALVSEGTAFIGSVGDSRVYWIENGSITQITEDHSVVAKLVARGQLTREEARNHPRSNVLYRTIGNDETVKVNTYRKELTRGGTLLLCTDGLWGEVDDEEIHRICAGEEHTDVICARLVQKADANGGKDNITAIVARVV